VNKKFLLATPQESPIGVGMNRVKIVYFLTLCWVYKQGWSTQTESLWCTL